jgi:hypothetical protein
MAPSEVHKKSVAWVKIPKTFQGSIRVVRGLGIRYLWIDSLCIVKDDEANWRKESLAMYSIFKNYFITIAAAAASGGTTVFSHKSSMPKIMKDAL